MQKTHPIVGRAGFSLLELSVVLVIIATLTGGGITMLTYSVEKKAVDITLHRLAVIQKTLLEYRRVFHVIPCPSDSSLASNALKFGRGEVSQVFGDECDADEYSPNLEGGIGDKIWGGGVPVRTLKLPDEYSYDGWGRRFTYFVDEDYTGYHAFNSTTIASSARLTVNDISGTSITTSAVYILLSHGPNGHGAFTRNGNTRMTAGTVNTSELSNCGCDSNAVQTAYDTVFVQGELDVGTAGLQGTIFDDILVYATRAQLRAAWE